MRRVRQSLPLEAQPQPACEAGVRERADAAVPVLPLPHQTQEQPQRPHALSPPGGGVVPTRPPRHCPWDLVRVRQSGAHCGWGLEGPARHQVTAPWCRRSRLSCHGRSEVVAAPRLWM